MLTGPSEVQRGDIHLPAVFSNARERFAVSDACREDRETSLVIAAVSAEHHGKQPVSGDRSGTGKARAQPEYSGDVRERAPILLL